MKKIKRFIGNIIIALGTVGAFILFLIMLSKIFTAP